MKVATARGFRDVLPEEAAERAAIRRGVADAFDSWGYGEVETPVVEDCALLEAATGPLEGTAFRLFDLDGTLLSLRPEMTVPVARLAALRLLDGRRGPLRLRYDAPVYREHASLRGQARQFTQLGIELIGVDGAAADAEVVALALCALAAAGLERHTVAIGTVAVLNAIIAASGASDEWRSAVLRAAHDRDLVSVERLAGERSLPSSVAGALREVTSIRGGAEAIDACRDLVGGFGCDAALDDLAAVLCVLDSLGHAARVAVDFGVVRGFGYYTGIVFEAYAPGLGAPLGGGGRYDGVLSTLGRPAPAAGFALGLERLHIAAEAAGAAPDARGIDDVVGGPAAAAFAAAADLRARGRRVEVSADVPVAQVETLAAARGARAVMAQ